MIRRSFQILPSIGPITESKLWKEGLTDWDDFIGSPSIKGFSEKRKVKADAQLKEASRLLDNGCSEYFCKILPQAEHWRLYGRFKSDCAYLDIETTGQGAYCDITVVGIYRKEGMRTLVRGQDLTRENIQSALEGAKLLVTYNGGSFDVPMLSYHYPLSVPRIPHFDLRTGCSRIGLVGGLKNVERSMGISREREIEYMTGEEAVYLWRAWEKEVAKMRSVF